MSCFLTTEEVIELHFQVSSSPLRDRGGLDSAVLQCGSTFLGVYLYQTVIEQGAVLLFTIANAHAFLDGNKRTAWLACATFLDNNGVELIDVEDDEVVDFVDGVASGKYELLGVATWLAQKV